MLKLYYAPGACSLAPHLALKETQIPHELVAVDLRAKTYAGGDFRKINPKGSVPVLQLDNGEILTEAAVILQYVADQQPEAGLIPRTGTWERYRCQEWLNFIATEIHKGFGPLWMPGTPEEYKPIVVKNLGRRFDIVNAALAESEYLMGRYTVADAYLFTVTSWAGYMKLDMSAWPHLNAFLERVRARPASQEALRAEGLLK